VSYGEALGGEATGRFGADIHAYGSIGNGFTIGGELSGSIEGYTGGYGCGTMSDGSGAIPAVAVSCLQPGIATHLLLGAEASPTQSTQLRFEVGLGATAVYLVPSQGGETQRDTFASGLIRAMYLAHVGDNVAGNWWVGVAVEERAIGFGDPHLVRSLGLVLEGRSK
jgi:hypothetical protein